MNPENTSPLQSRWTAAELRKLPPQQRDAILEEAAARAEPEYRNHPELMDCEAFGKEDFYGDSIAAPER